MYTKTSILDLQKIAEFCSYFGVHAHVNALPKTLPRILGSVKFNARLPTCCKRLGVKEQAGRSNSPSGIFSTMMQDEPKFLVASQKLLV